MAVTLYNQGRGRSHAEEAMCYPESPQCHHRFTAPDNTHLFKFITGNVMQFVLGDKLDGTLSRTLNGMLKPSQKPLCGSCRRDTNQPNQLLFLINFDWPQKQSGPRSYGFFLAPISDAFPEPLCFASFHKQSNFMTNE